jgi:hypothetical protein
VVRVHEGVGKQLERVKHAHAQVNEHERLPLRGAWLWAGLCECEYLGACQDKERGALALQGVADGELGPFFSEGPRTSAAHKTGIG